MGRGRLGDADQLAGGVHRQPRDHHDRGRQRGRLQRAPQLPLDVDAHGRAAERGDRRCRRAGQPVRRRRRPDAGVGARPGDPRAASTCWSITGGAALIRDAFGTGKRVIAAGPGVPVSVLDETADPVHAAREIFAGAVYENTILCIGEKSVVAADAVHDRLLAAFADLPARILTADEVEQVYRTVIDDSGDHPRTRAEFVGKDAEVLLAAAGLESRKPVGLLVAPVEPLASAALDGAVPPVPARRARPQRRGGHRPGRRGRGRQPPHGDDLLPLRAQRRALRPRDAAA